MLATGSGFSTIGRNEQAVSEREPTVLLGWAEHCERALWEVACERAVGAQAGVQGGGCASPGPGVRLGVSLVRLPAPPANAGKGPVSFCYVSFYYEG